MSAHRPAALAVALLTIAGLIGTIPSQAAATPKAPAPQVAPTTQPKSNGSAAKAVFFAADGMRQDLVERFAAQGTMPTMRNLLRHGVEGQRRRPAHPGAAEHRRRLVHHRDRRLARASPVPPTTRSTSTTQPSPTAPPRSTPACCRPRPSPSPPSAAARRSSRWSGPAARTAPSTARPSISGRSSPDAASPPTSSRPRRPAVRRRDSDHLVRAAVRPRGYAGQDPFAGAAPTTGQRLDERAASYSPAKEMRMRVLDFGTDKYGLDAYIYDSTDDHTTNYDRVLFARNKNGADPVADLRARASGPTSRSRSSAAALDGKTAGMLVKVEALNADVSQVRLFHTSVTRANATWPDWPGEAGITDFAEFVAQKFPTSTAGDFAVLEAGVVERGHLRPAGSVLGEGAPAAAPVHRRHYHPDLRWSGIPTTDEFQHQFLGLVTPRLPGEPEPRLRRRQARRHAGRSGGSARGFIRARPIRAPTPPCGSARPAGQQPDHLRRFRPRLRAAVPGRRRQQGAGRPRPAVQAADLQLPPGQRARPSARPRPAGPVAPCRST